MDLSGLNQVNKSLTDLGSATFAVGAEWQRIEDQRTRALTLLDFHTQATAETQKLLTDLGKKSFKELLTPDGNIGDQSIDSLAGSFTDKYQAVSDPMLAISMRKIGDGLVREARNKYRAAFEEKRIDHGLAVYLDFKNLQYDQTVTSLNSKDRADNINLFESGLADLVNSGIMNEYTAAKERLGFKNKLDKDSAELLIDSLVPGSLQTPEVIQEKINDKALFPYLNEADRLEKLHKLATQSRIFNADVRKQAEEEALQNIWDILSQANMNKDSVPRSVQLDQAESLLNAYSQKRTITSEKREHLIKTIRDLKGGKDDISDPQAKLELTEGVAAGKIGLLDISSYPGVSAADKDILIKWRKSLDNQLEAVVRSAANQQRSIDRAELNKNIALAISEGKHIITQKGPFSTLSNDEAYWANLFVQDVLKTAKEGGDPWDVVRNIHNYTGKMEIPFVNVPGSFQGRPKSLGDVESLKTWIPYYQSQGNTKEANALAEQLTIAEKIIKGRELNAQRSRDTKGDRKFR